MEEKKEKDARIVKLNVGGRKFYTTRSTLEQYRGFLSSSLLYSRQDEIFIDRNGDVFVHILEFLRNMEYVYIIPLNEIIIVYLESKFYQIEPLIAALKSRIISQNFKMDPYFAPLKYSAVTSDHVPFPIYIEDKKYTLTLFKLILTSKGCDSPRYGFGYLRIVFNAITTEDFHDVTVTDEGIIIDREGSSAVFHFIYLFLSGEEFMSPLVSHLKSFHGQSRAKYLKDFDYYLGPDNYFSRNWNKFL